MDDQSYVTLDVLDASYEILERGADLEEQIAARDPDEPTRRSVGKPCARATKGRSREHYVVFAAWIRARLT